MLAEMELTAVPSARSAQCAVGNLAPIPPKLDRPETSDVAASAEKIYASAGNPLPMVADSTAQRTAAVSESEQTAEARAQVNQPGKPRTQDLKVLHSGSQSGTLVQVRLAMQADLAEEFDRAVSAA